MGSFDGAECCELVGLYMLSCLKHLKINIGVYRDDALGVLKMTSRQAENMKKEICNIFKKHKLSIEIVVNAKIVNFLDITLDLESGIHKPYMKPGNNPIYINQKSNHPPSIIKNIPAAVNRRLSEISSNEVVFKEAAPPYQEALEKAGYQYTLKYDPPKAKSNKTSRTRNKTWFNPPYSRNVSTNVGAKFLKLINTCFPPSHPLSKIINRNTIKVSYRCMPNMGRVISKHNSQVSKKEMDVPPPGCNCRGGPSKCPVGGKCLTQGVVYQATVVREDDGSIETYTGLTARTFKRRLYEHNQDFNHQKREGTTLSNHVWGLKTHKSPIKYPGKYYPMASRKTIS